MRSAFSSPGTPKTYQRHHEIGVFLARHAEDVLDPLFFEASNQQI
jgi:hypothetical protein